MPDGSLINIGELAKPATVLIEKISDAVGALYKPYQIERCAKAEAKAERIKALAQIELSEELERRALKRFVAEETQKQCNIEAITRQALPLLAENASPQEMENDWIVNFFDKCRIVSDQEMQRLWANLLANEANSPGKYSKRTINLLSDLDKSDAELFTALCGYVWEVEDKVPIVFAVDEKIYNDCGIHFSTLAHLESLGIIQFNGLSGFMVQRMTRYTQVTYFDKNIGLVLPKETDNEIELGHVLFTKVGQDLATICGAKPVDGYYEYVHDHWKKLGYIPTNEA